MVTHADPPTEASDLLEANEYMIAYSPTSGVAFTTNAHIGKAETRPNTTTPKLRDESEYGNLAKKIALWGASNDLPKQLIAHVESNPELASTLDWKANAIIAGGLVYGYLVNDPQTGRQTLELASDPAVDEWLENTNIDLYLRQISKDTAVLNHGFTEMMLNEAGDFMPAIACQDTSFCRFGLQDEKGRINFGYICADWDRATGPDSEGVTELPLIDPHYDVQSQLAFGGKRRYLYPTSGTGTGRVYYIPAAWHSLIVSGWLELANSIPKFKKALLKNQFTIKYHVQIPDWFWEAKYPDWDQKPALKRLRVQAELDAFNKKMAGVDNAGNNIMTTFKTEEGTGKAFDGWKIEAIKDELKDGKYIEDSKEACSHIFFGVGVDPTLIGAAPGKGQGAGSGSDKRVAQNIFILNSKPTQDIMLEPIKAAFLFNKFGAKQGKRCYDIQFRSYLVSTLDSGKAAKSDA